MGRLSLSGELTIHMMDHEDTKGHENAQNLAEPDLPLDQVRGIPAHNATALAHHGICTVGELIGADHDDVAEKLRLSKGKLRRLLRAARTAITKPEQEGDYDVGSKKKGKST